ncbi:MAG: hypothetical protein M3Q45_10820, partial [Chloroflexota bacterium]|nr:hypothetical protein [Chloroflexota bacterium]
GNRTKVTVKKNKVAPPFKVAEFDIMYNEGISTVGDLIDLGVDQEIISKRGSFFAYGEIRLGQGRENAKAFLESNPELAAKIDAVIRNTFGLPVNLEPKAGFELPQFELPQLELPQLELPDMNESLEQAA